MLKFIEHTGIIAPLNVSNIDTDLIIPKQFLKGITKIGLGKYLFHNWRYLDENQLLTNQKFILNNKIYSHASILLTRDNFGCGSSREHAVWSLLDYGFRVIIAQSFSDIFSNNSLINKLFLIVLDKKDIDLLFDIVKKNKGIKCNINLLHRKICIDEKIFSFQLDSHLYSYFLNDLDSIDLTIKYIKKIKSYEKNLPIPLLKRKSF